LESLIDPGGQLQTCPAHVDPKFAKFEMSDSRLPIRDLVETRLKELGIQRSELALRCGYKNVNKGNRRIEAICGGDLDSSSGRMILKALPTTLEVSEDVVNAAARETADALDRRKRTAAAEREEAWRASFKPHAYLVGTETRPSSITMYGFSGGPERWLRIPFDYSQRPVTYATQALAVVRNTPTVAFFGPTTGYIVNYTPDRAVRFDLDGDPVEVLPRAYPPGQIELQTGRSKISSESWCRIMGFIVKPRF
jgi:hypothetical protein